MRFLQLHFKDGFVEIDSLTLSKTGIKKSKVNEEREMTKCDFTPNFILLKTSTHRLLP
jgi:hypothetical protein